MGGLTLYGPSSAPFDEAWDPVLINDWVHENTSVAFQQELAGGIPLMNSLLLNGSGMCNINFDIKRMLRRGSGNYQCSDLDPQCCTSCINATFTANGQPGPPKCSAGVDPAFCCNPDERCLTRASNGTPIGQLKSSTFNRTFEAGKRYLLRIVNSSAESMFRFSIDGHQLQVIATDLVAIQPYVTDDLFIGIGE